MEIETMWRKWVYPILILTVFIQFSFAEENDTNGASINENPIRTKRSLRMPTENSNENYRYLCMESEEDIQRTVQHLGVKCTCPSIYAPVCGSDHITYHNRCFMQCRANQSSEKYNRYKIKLRVKYFGECRKRHGHRNIHQS